MFVFLDDLQWSDEATLELLAALASGLEALPVIIVGAYRSDGLPRDHMLRWLRNELRRGGCRDELVLAPLDLDGTGELLAALLPDRPSPALVRALHDRTQGVPFFVEELARALVVSGRLQPGARGLELGGDGEVPAARHRPRRGPSWRVAAVGGGARGGSRRRRSRARRSTSSSSPRSRATRAWPSSSATASCATRAPGAPPSATR